MKPWYSNSTWSKWRKKKDLLLSLNIAPPGANWANNNIGKTCKTGIHSIKFKPYERLNQFYNG